MKSLSLIHALYSALSNLRKNKAAQSAAFSLVEMLMALLVASLLLAALAPVMTKKMNENIHISGTGETYKAPADMQCYSYSDTNPSVDISINDVYSVSFLIASAGGGGAGATSEKVLDNQSISAQSTSTANASNNLTITEDMDEFKIDFMSGGGGGAGGGSVYDTGWAPRKQADCEPFGVYIQPDYNGTKYGACVSKYNPGEGRDGSPSLTGVTSVPANATTSCTGGNCCWYGNNAGVYNTASISKCSASANGITYSGCYRTVCQWKAANTICGNWKPLGNNGTVGSLPTYDEFLSWKNTGLLSDKNGKPGSLNWNPTIKAGLQMCINSATIMGSPLCYPTQRCKGAALDWDSYHNYCFPHHIWSGTQDTSNKDYYWDILMSASSDVAMNSYPISRGLSVRCMLESTYKFTSISGGGGGASPSITSNNAVNDELNTYIKNNIGGTIELTAGGGGSGGESASESGKKADNGTNGKDSTIKVKNKEGVVVFKITVPGGNFGYGADGTTTSGTGGNAGNSKALNTCYKQYLETGTATVFNCTNTGKEGIKGEIKVSGIASGGTGGISSYAGSSTSGAAYNSSTGNGATLSSGSNPGAGGGGGRSIENISNSTGYIIGSGGSGSGGLVKITYKRKFAAAAGGGGGGGTLAQIKDVQLGKQTDCTLTIGKGGKGGNADNNGTDGGSSSIKCSTDVRTFTVPGGKGGKIGISAQNSTSKPTAGTGGEYGDINKAATTAIKDYNASKKVIVEGIKGADGTYDEINKKSIGGRGGKSGTGTFGACGGLYIEEDEKEGLCSISDTDIYRIEGKGFEYKDVVTPSTNELASLSYGIAGSGGGGGGWERNLDPGKGGDGMNGYVCVYWYNTD